MKISKITAIYYSPTGNTKKTVMYMAKVLAAKLKVPYTFLSYTLPKDREGVHTFAEDELVLFASSVYAGRIPNKLLPYVQQGFQGNQTPVIPVVVFGNRNFDHALAELCGELSIHGFLPLAAAAVASQHAFSSLIGTGRPDGQDLKNLSDFTEAAGDYLQSHSSVSPISVTGNWPDAPYYKPLGEDGEPVNFLKAKPKTREDQCDHCGACAKMCPMGAIDMENTSLVPGTCIKCQACIRICHTDAKYFDDPAFLSHVKMLEEHYSVRAESKFFLHE